MANAQVVIRKSGEKVWLPPKPAVFEDPSYKFSYKVNRHYRNQKRRAVAKDRERIRRRAREAKASAVVSVA